MSCCTRDKSEKQQIYQHETEKKYYQEALEQEKKVWRHTGLEVGKQIVSYNVYLDGLQKTWIHTTECYSEKNKEEPFILVHGYGSASTSFYKIVKGLSQQRRVLVLDIQGMGLSSHEEFNLNKIDDCIQYFNNSFKNYMDKQGIQKAVFIGHSFGGYIVSRFALQYPEKIVRLHLLSPLGFTKQTKEQVSEFEGKMLNKMGILKGILFQTLIKSAWRDKETPTSFYQKPLVPTSMFLDGYLECRLGIKGQEKEDIKQYANCIFRQKVSSERAFHCMFMFPNMIAVQPLEKLMAYKMKGIYMNFIYGDENDWMDREGAKRLVYNKKVQGNILQIKKGTHNMFVEYPELVVQEILRCEFLDLECIPEINSQLQSCVSETLSSNSQLQQIQVQIYDKIDIQKSNSKDQQTQLLSQNN